MTRWRQGRDTGRRRRESRKRRRQNFDRLKRCHIPSGTPVSTTHQVETKEISHCVSIGHHSSHSQLSYLLTQGTYSLFRVSSRTTSINNVNICSNRSYILGPKQLTYSHRTDPGPLGGCRCLLLFTNTLFTILNSFHIL